MFKKALITAVAASLCLAVVGTSFAQSVGIQKTNAATIRKIPRLVARPAMSVTPKGGVQNWAAIAAVSAAVYAATEVAHHVKESWFPGIQPATPVMNPAVFDAPRVR